MQIPPKLRGLSLIKEKEIVWSPHPRFPNVRIASLMMRSEETPPLECALVEMPPDADIAEHVHDQEDDILYVLRGKAVMWVEGKGDMPLSEGSFLRIPKGTRHRPHSFEDGFRIFNVWAATPSFPNPNPNLGERHD
jgi:mannose-6-phosphate isomerase-like protein (cupin superfamily)